MYDVCVIDCISIFAQLFFLLQIDVWVDSNWFRWGTISSYFLLCFGIGTKGKSRNCSMTTLMACIILIFSLFFFLTFLFGLVFSSYFIRYWNYCCKVNITYSFFFFFFLPNKWIRLSVLPIHLLWVGTT